MDKAGDNPRLLDLKYATPTTLNRSWKNVRPTGMELAIEYDLEVTDIGGQVQKDESSHFMYSLGSDSTVLSLDYRPGPIKSGPRTG